MLIALEPFNILKNESETTQLLFESYDHIWSFRYERLGQSPFGRNAERG